MLEALRASMDLYVNLADPLLELYGVDAAREARTVVLDALKAGLEWDQPQAT